MKDIIRNISIVGLEIQRSVDKPNSFVSMSTVNRWHFYVRYIWEEKDAYNVRLFCAMFSVGPDITM